MFGGFSVHEKTDSEDLGRKPDGRTAAAMPIAIDSSVCHAGGGLLEASRDIIANVLTGGTKLRATRSVEFGACA